MHVRLLSAAPAVGAHTLTADRIVATAAVVVAVAGAIIGGLALARSAGHRGRRRSTIAVLAGIAGTAVGGMVVVTADGGPGTGNGIVGGYMAVVVGLTAALLGGLAQARSRRSARCGSVAVVPHQTPK
jgi:hypothetical protein